MPGLMNLVGDGISNFVFNWGSTDAPPPPPPPAPLELPGNSDVPSHLRTLVAIVGAVDQDPINADNFFEALTTIARVPGTLDNYYPITLEMVRALATDRAGVSPMENITSIGMKVWFFLVAFAQSGKTNTQLFTFWSNGILSGFPGVHYSYSRSNEGKRMGSSAKDFNALVTRCAALMQLTEQGLSYKTLDFNDSEDANGSLRFIESVKTMETSNIIPVLSFLGNSSKVKNSIEIVEELSMHVGRDDIESPGPNGFPVNNGAMRALVILDEAELFVQPTKVKRSKSTNEFGQVQETITTTHGQLHMSMNPGVFDGNSKIKLKNRVEDPNAPPGRTPAFDVVLKDTVFDCFTSVVNVTATPQAFAVSSANHGRGKIVQAVLAQPSKNYWAYVQKSTWDCKKIENKVCVDWRVMASDMMLAPEHVERHGLVAISSTKNGTSSVDGQKTLAKEASLKNPGLVAIGWEGTKVSLYTSDVYWTEAFDGSGSFDKMHAGEAVNGDQVFCFTSRKGNHTFQEWDAVSKKVDSEHLSSYMGVMSFIAEVLKETNRSAAPLDRVRVPKTLLFAMNMVGRCTPVKAYGHEFPLSDMFAAFGKNWHDECVQQVLGRLNGVDKRTQAEGKTIWASKVDLEFLYTGLVELPFFVKNIGNGKNIREIYDYARRELELCNEGIYDQAIGEGSERGHGVRDVEKLRLAKRTRKNNGEETALRAKKRFKYAAGRKGVAVPSSPIPLHFSAPAVPEGATVAAIAAAAAVAATTAATAVATAATVAAAAAVASAAAGVIGSVGSPVGAPVSPSGLAVRAGATRLMTDPSCWLGLFAASVKTNDKSFRSAACDPCFKAFLSRCTRDDRFPVEMHGTVRARKSMACVVVREDGDGNGDENTITLKLKGPKKVIMAAYKLLCYEAQGGGGSGSGSVGSGRTTDCVTVSKWA